MMLSRQLLLILVLANTISFGQTFHLDSCGIDNNPELNTFEIEYVNKVLLPDSVANLKKAFDFRSKKIAFFICNGEESEDGFITKDKFFATLRRYGHRRPRGIFVLNEDDKHSAGQLDAIILIDCKMYSNSDLVERLSVRIKNNNKLPGQ